MSRSGAGGIGTSSWCYSGEILEVCSHTFHFPFPLLVICTPPALNLAFFERFQSSFSHGRNALHRVCPYSIVGLSVIELDHKLLLFKGERRTFCPTTL